MAKSRPVIKYVLEPTSAHKNNCAFHAFLFGILAVIDQIEAELDQVPDKAFKRFIEEAALALGVAETWGAVKKKALQMRRDDKQKHLLQEKLGDVLRELAIELTSEEPAKTEHCLELEQNLLAVYDKYPHRVKEDDIFSRHAFIETEFKKIKANAKATVEDAQKWWRTAGGGFDRYQAEMKKPGAMAGDDQLGPLARYFGVTLRIIAPRFDPDRPVTWYSANGALTMPHLTFAQAKELANREVTEGVLIEKAFDAKKPLVLKPISEKELMANLSAVPRIADVAAYLRATKFIPYKGTHGYHAEVPVAWQKDPAFAACIDQLVLRGVIFNDAKVGGYVFTADNSNKDTLAETLQRIDEMPGKGDIIARWQAAYRDAPAVTLTNPSATHWSNVIIIDVAEEEAKKAAAEKAAAEEKAAEEKAAQEKAAQEKAAQEKAAKEKSAAEEKVKKAAEEAAKKAAEKAAPIAKEKTRATANEFFTSTLIYVNKVEAKLEKSKWNEFVDTAVVQATDASVAKHANYALANAAELMSLPNTVAVDTIDVSKEIQEKLDEQLAKELQQQEYAAYKRK